MSITTRRGPECLDDAVVVSQSIPEFDSPYPKSTYEQRLANTDSVIEVVYVDDRPVAFKIGYDRDKDGSFYSWMGGVLPEFRRQGHAQLLASSQERYAIWKGYTSIKLKTRRRHTAMQALAQKNGFTVTSEEATGSPDDNLFFEKKLKAFKHHPINL
ncbi:MAG TPA: GNAT family N-acetyltransferase [Candidatus Nanoarchaeia archaeon]|nr:GNAT family N-acetyltransferase [Candidatus Nanoarchaeia archaeon]